VRFANLKHIYLSLAARQSEAIAPATRCRSWLKRTNYLSINRKSYIYHLQPYHPIPSPYHDIGTGGWFIISDLPEDDFFLHNTLPAHTGISIWAFHVQNLAKGKPSITCCKSHR
jgi:hypothetical protein